MRLSAKLRSASGGALFFWCPGCATAHMVMVGDGAGPRWGYNADPERPTFSPSVFVNPPGPYFSAGAASCHSFIRDGQIQFLNDCSHELAGRTVEIPDFPDDYGIGGEDDRGDVD